MRSFLEPLLTNPALPHRLRNSRNDAIVASRLLTAFDSASRRRGLLSHRSLPDDHALIIAPTNAIHTFFMRFDIDVAFVARDGRVLKVRPALRPWRVAGALRAFAVIELAAGALARADLAAGDNLVIAAEAMSAED